MRRDSNLPVPGAYPATTSRPKAKSETLAENFGAADNIQRGDARRPVDIVHPFDGNTASALDAQHNAEEASAARRTSLSEFDSPLDRSRSDSALKANPRRLASMAKDLRPSDSTGSATINTRAGALLLDAANRGSVGETTMIRPGEIPLPAQASKSTSHPDARLHDSISRFEELTREAAYLAHDAADRHRPDEVSRIMEEAAQALHTSSQTRDARHDLRNEPLVDAGGAVPWPNAWRPKDDDNASTFSKTSVESDQQPTFSQATATGFATSATTPFRNDISPYRPPSLTAPKAIDFAYAQSNLPEQISPTSTPAIDVRRRSKPKARFEEPTRQETVPGSLPTISDVRAHINEHGEPPIMPRHSSITVRRPRGSDSSESSPTMAETPSHAEPIGQAEGHNWGRDKYDEHDYLPSDALDGKHHVTLADNQIWSIHHHRRQPIARNWTTARKRVTALIVCLNTALIGFIIGIYAGEVPAIQYSLNDLDHHVILGNVVLFLGMGLTTFFFWPLPLLHGRKPYTLLALGIALPLQFPQAVMVDTRRVGGNGGYMTGLLVSRALSGFALGFCHINLKTTLLDLFGASLQSTHPHGEFVVTDDVRRHGGGMGLWLGFWSFCFIGSLSLGFMIGADIVSGLNVSWGFYITVILIAVILFLDVVTPETRRSPHRRTMAEIELPDMRISRRVARGEICMHVYGDGPKWWWEEVFAGVYLSLKMLDQPGFGLMAIYLGWVYGQIVLIIVVRTGTLHAW